MHYSNIVIIEKTEDIEDAVERAMERGHDDWWDWYQIGGRWTGHFDGYDPDTDPALLVPCKLCGATGKRTDMEVENGCNGCGGTGKARLWPTSWPQRDQDAIPVSALTEKHMEVHRIVIDGYGAYANEEYVPWMPTIEEKFQKKKLPPLEWLKEEFPDHLAVIVDNHN